jgi:cysteinyl-tRNA synthetase
MNEYATSDVVYADSVALLLSTFDAWMQIFGVQMATETELLDADIEQMIQQRDAARAAKDFATSDRLRDELVARGIILEDTAQGTRWRRA